MVLAAILSCLRQNALGGDVDVEGVLEFVYGGRAVAGFSSLEELEAPQFITSAQIYGLKAVRNKRRKHVVGPKGRRVILSQNGYGSKRWKSDIFKEDIINIISLLLCFSA